MTQSCKVRLSARWASLLRAGASGPADEIVGIGLGPHDRLARLIQAVFDTPPPGIGDRRLLARKVQLDLLLRIVRAEPAAQRVRLLARLRLHLQDPAPGLGPTRLGRRLGGAGDARGPGLVFPPLSRRRVSGARVWIQERRRAPAAGGGHLRPGPRATTGRFARCG